MSIKGRIFSIIILITLFFVTGCTNQSSTQELEKEIEKLNTELKATKEKNEELGKLLITFHLIYKCWIDRQEGY